MKSNLPPILAEAYADRDAKLRNRISVEQLESTGTKKCTSCNIIKPRGDFSIHRRNKDGLQAHCHACRRKAYRLKVKGGRKPLTIVDKRSDHA